ncbi:hypothetical protein ACJX0J_005421, partial [Zea mays]
MQQHIHHVEIASAIFREIILQGELLVAVLLEAVQEIFVYLNKNYKPKGQKKLDRWTRTLQ